MPIDERVGAAWIEWERVDERVGNSWEEWERAWELQGDGTWDEIYSSGPGLLILDGARGLWRIDSTNPSNTSGDFGRIGILPNGFRANVGGNSLVFFNNRLYATEATRTSNTRLWSIDLDNPGRTTGGFGTPTTFVSNDRVQGMTVLGSSAYIISQIGSQRRIRTIGLPGVTLGTPTGLPNIRLMRSLAGYNNEFYIMDTSTTSRLWRINPANTLQTTGRFGNRGSLPAGAVIYAIAPAPSGLFAAGQNDLWLINPDDPDSISGIYGRIGALPSALTIPTGMTI